MSTMTTRQAALRQALGEPAVPETSLKRLPDKRSAISRLFTWYRDAVLSPASETEKDDWQKHSF